MGKYATWIDFEVGSNDVVHRWKCSNCYKPSTEYAQYCPHCGAKMNISPNYSLVQITKVD